MKIRNSIGGFAGTLGFIAFVLSTTGGVSAMAAQTVTQTPDAATEPAPLRFRAYTVPAGTDISRASLLAQALDFALWPRTEALFAAPRIDKSLLDNPQTVTHDSHSCARIQFGDTQWKDCTWSWRALAALSETESGELPAEQEALLLDKLTQEQRADQAYVNSFLEQQRRRYRARRHYSIEGQLDIEVCATPSDLGAKELLLARLANNMLPAQDLATKLKNALPPEKLGNAGYLIASRKKDDVHVRFVRNNIFVSVRASGSFADQALPLAHKIDSAIYSQPSMSAQELLEQQQKDLGAVKSPAASP